MRIDVETLVRAPLAEVWRAYTTPEDILVWNTASDDWHTVAASVDLRPGGAFSSRMEAKDGSFGFDFAGTYTAVEPMRLIAYEFGGRTAEVHFDDTEDGVAVTVSFDAEAENPADRQRDGWQAILNNFARHTARGQGQPTA
ncbi:MAG: SRPBCC domain-containing protein [Notoacmeibacter sp.]|nr:SRPBCC domain-containing protein [Notoacmeibacter sp.]MCC0032441.1 SRPBCC domain-containing protein [Brucellaceae bacterium]